MTKFLDRPKMPTIESVMRIEPARLEEVSGAIADAVAELASASSGQLAMTQEADARVAIDAVVENREARNGGNRFVLGELHDGERAVIEPAAGRQALERGR